MNINRAKFRGKDVSGIWRYGNVIEKMLPRGGTYCYIYVDAEDEEGKGKEYWVDRWTIGECTGIPSKVGELIYEGDSVVIKQPIRTTQTHVGDNIPNGSYTEPMEPGIEVVNGCVVWKDGMFIMNTDKSGQEYIPLAWQNRQWTEEEIKEQIAVYRSGGQWNIWDNPEEGDLQYLLEEYKLKDLQELIEYISGIEVVGNIYTNDV